MPSVRPLETLAACVGMLGQTNLVLLALLLIQKARFKEDCPCCNPACLLYRYHLALVVGGLSAEQNLKTAWTSADRLSTAHMHLLIQSPNMNRDSAGSKMMTTWQPACHTDEINESMQCVHLSQGQKSL